MLYNCPGAQNLSHKQARSVYAWRHGSLAAREVGRGNVSECRRLRCLKRDPKDHINISSLQIMVSAIPLPWAFKARMIDLPVYVLFLAAIERSPWRYHSGCYLDAHGT